MKKEYTIEKKEQKPVIAICYDFDKTLTPTDMQAQGFIQSCDIDVDTFWKQSNGMAEENDMDMNLSWMFNMKEMSVGTFYITKQKLQNYGKKIELFSGVETWFDRIDEFGKENDVIIEHYIISSGLKEMIEGTSIYNKFKKVYASSFYFDDKGCAIWPAQVVNYTNKTQFLFRIEKGVLDINDSRINDYFEEKALRIPFENIIYIGDSDTDIPCMKLVNNYGGYSIGVYDPDKQDKTKVYRMINEQRINYYAKADYTENEELDSLVKRIVKNISSKEELKKYHYSNVDEYEKYLEANNEHKLLKEKLIDNLEESSSFYNTHAIIKEMKKIDDWSNDEKDEIVSIGLINSQVRSIIMDNDIKMFINNLLKNKENSNDNDKKILKLISK